MTHMGMEIHLSRCLADVVLALPADPARSLLQCTRDRRVAAATLTLVCTDAQCCPAGVYRRHHRRTRRAVLISKAACSWQEAEAAMAAPTLALSAALLARLSWLLSCWWAFGGSGDANEDEQACHATYACQPATRNVMMPSDVVPQPTEMWPLPGSYTFLAQLLSSNMDVAARLQAASVFRESHEPWKSIAVEPCL